MKDVDFKKNIIKTGTLEKNPLIDPSEIVKGMYFGGGSNGNHDADIQVYHEIIDGFGNGP